MATTSDARRVAVVIALGFTVLTVVGAILLATASRTDRRRAAVGSLVLLGGAAPAMATLCFLLACRVDTAGGKNPRTARVKPVPSTVDE